MRQFVRQNGRLKVAHYIKYNRLLVPKWVDGRECMLAGALETLKDMKHEDS